MAKVLVKVWPQVSTINLVLDIYNMYICVVQRCRKSACRGVAMCFALHGSEVPRAQIT